MDLLPGCCCYRGGGEWDLAYIGECCKLVLIDGIGNCRECAVLSMVADTGGWISLSGGSLLICFQCNGICNAEYAGSEVGML